MAYNNNNKNNFIAPFSGQYR